MSALRACRQPRLMCDRTKQRFGQCAAGLCAASQSRVLSVSHACSRPRLSRWCCRAGPPLCCCGPRLLRPIDIAAGPICCCCCILGICLFNALPHAQNCIHRITARHSTAQHGCRQRLRRASTAHNHPCTSWGTRAPFLYALSLSFFVCPTTPAMTPFPFVTRGRGQ